MKIHYYGTGAGAGIPEIYCSCRVCEHARAHRGPNIRTRSQAVIDNCLGIDFPVDTLMHTIYGGLDMRNVHHVLITHAHHDHFLPADVLSRFVGVTDPIRFYCSPASGKGLKASVEAREKAFNEGTRIRTSSYTLEVIDLAYNTPIDIMDYRVTPLRARHADALEAMIFLIESKGKAILWGHDTGLLRSDAIAYLKEQGTHLDFVSLDCTLKRGEQITRSHMDLDWCIETANLLRRNGNADATTRFALSHIGHLVERTHDELCQEAAEVRMMVAYDGFEIEI